MKKSNAKTQAGNQAAAAFQVLESKDYGKFQVSQFNRNIRASTRSLEDSMKKHGFIAAYPIHCRSGAGGKLIIKAGHHRFEVARKLGIPVFYIVVNDSATITDLEQASRPWSVKDYVDSYVRAVSAPHIAVKAFHDRTGISYTQSASMLGGDSASSKNGTRRLKDGTFRIKDATHAETVGEITDQLKAVGVSFATNENLVSAICSFVWVKAFDPKVFIHRVATNLSMFYKCATLVQYQDMLERVYNHGARHKIAIAFLAREHARSRSAVKRYAS